MLQVLQGKDAEYNAKVVPTPSSIKLLKNYVGAGPTRRSSEIELSLAILH
jgi:hypothetical protein